MTFLKNLTVSLFSFLLFLSLTVFGIAFAVKSTALNPDFVTAELNRLEITPLVKEFVQIDPPPEIPNLNEIINKTVADIEPQFKVETDSAIRSVYDYLLGKTPEPRLALTLRQTYLSTDFVAAAVSSIDAAPLLAPTISQQLAQAIPIQIPNLETYVTQALTAAEPSLKKQLLAASGPVFDYLLGISPSLKATISLQEALASLKDILRQAFINSPPEVEIAGIPLTDQRGAAFDAFYPTFASAIPTTYTIDTSIIQPELRASITDGITSAEEGLTQARQYVAMFQQYYTLLLVFMAVMALGIILIVRNVKDITHILGIPLFTYGALEYAGILVTKYLISSGRMQFSEIPPQLETWLLQLINNSMKPLETFSIALLIVGLVLTAISFLYKPRKDINWS